MFTDAADLIDALEGNQGEEVQQEALDFAEQTGLLGQWQAEAAEDGEAEYLDALASEITRVEENIGRKLTEGEVNAMVNTLSTQDLADQIVPDFQAEFGQDLAAARDSEPGRVHLGAEAAQRVFDEQGRSDPSAPVPQPQFERPDYGDEGPGEVE